MDLHGQGWLQLGELALAFVLSALVGLEREVRQKAAGLRTYSLVGVSAALFMLISKYGFDDVLRDGRVMVDPSRVAAQIVSGIGFVGGGVIFMRRNVVRGLTTASSVWLTAALGMACGAGLPILAVAATAGHFLVMLGIPPLIARFLPQHRRAATRLRLHYQDRRGRLRAIMLACSELRFTIEQVEVDRVGDVPDVSEEAAELIDRENAHAGEAGRGVVVLNLRVRGAGSVAELVARLGDLDGVVGAGTLDEIDIE